MGIDYYGVLNLKQNCNDLEIKRAFRRLAIQYNPHRQEDESVRELFALAAEAYDTLHDPYRRTVYDQFGEEGLKRGWQGSDKYYEPYTYHGNPIRTYQEFFGTASPYADLLDALHDPHPLFNLPEGRGVRRKMETIRRPLPLTLEEVFHGGLKKVRITRHVLIGVDKTTTEAREHVLKINIKPGLPSGTEFKFVEVGDQGPTTIPGDLVFVTEDRPHDRLWWKGEDITTEYDMCIDLYNITGWTSVDKSFKLSSAYHCAAMLVTGSGGKGTNLLMMCNVDLKEALTGCTIVVNTLDHKTLRVPITQVTTPEYEKVIQGEGMPQLTDWRHRGNLVIRFNMALPPYLPQASKKMVTRALRLAAVGGGAGEVEHIHKFIMLDKMRRISKSERLPQDL
uniref:J domain-containing protein n=1 Tax=Timema cristinae TaxID=61476 RepID=A0A7R9D7I1_TIMCR|nr:unnamed protein product [Timema cristinae]